MLFGGLAFAFMLEPILTLILVAVLPVMLVVVLFIAGRGIRLYEALQRSNDAMVRKIRDDYGHPCGEGAFPHRVRIRFLPCGGGQVASDEMRAGIWTGRKQPHRQPAFKSRHGGGGAGRRAARALRGDVARQDRRLCILLYSHSQRRHDGQPPVRHPCQGRRVGKAYLRDFKSPPRTSPSARGRGRRGARGVQGRHLLLRRGDGGGARLFCTQKRGTSGRFGRNGQRKEHAGAASSALLRREQRGDFAGRAERGQHPARHSARKVRDRVPERFHHGGNGRGQRGFLPRHSQRAHRARPARGAGGLRVRAGAGPAIPPRRPRRQPFGRQKQRILIARA